MVNTEFLRFYGRYGIIKVFKEVGSEEGRDRSKPIDY